MLTVFMPDVDCSVTSVLNLSFCSGLAMGGNGQALDRPVGMLWALYSSNILYHPNGHVDSCMNSCMNIAGVTF